MFKKKASFTILCIVMSAILSGCYFSESGKEQQDDTSIATDKPITDNNETPSSTTGQKRYKYEGDFSFFGTWRYEKIAMVSEPFLEKDYEVSPIGRPMRYVIDEWYGL